MASLDARAADATMSVEDAAPVGTKGLGEAAPAGKGAPEPAKKLSFFEKLKAQNEAKKAEKAALK